jgi:hypothetical protein
LTKSRSRPTSDAAVPATLRKIEELLRRDASHLDAPFGLYLVENSAFGLELPYASRAEIGLNLWKFLPHREVWPLDYRVFIGGRLLLEISCYAQIGREWATRLIEAFTPSLLTTAIRKSDANVLWTFIWSFGMCRSVWYDGLSPSLLGFWDFATQDRIFGRLKSLMRKARTDDEKLNLFALAGTLLYFAPEMSERLAVTLKGNITGFPRLIEKVKELPFVPGALAILRLALIGPPRIAFSRSRLERIIAKSVECEERGRAIEQLIESLRRVSRD